MVIIRQRLKPLGHENSMLKISQGGWESSETGLEQSLKKTDFFIVYIKMTRRKTVCEKNFLKQQSNLIFVLSACNLEAN